MIVALKCDLREKHTDEEDTSGANDLPNSKRERDTITYQEGLEVAKRIGALRYLGTLGSTLEEQGASDTNQTLQNAQRKEIGGLTKLSRRLLESHFR